MEMRQLEAFQTCWTSKMDKNTSINLKGTDETINLSRRGKQSKNIAPHFFRRTCSCPRARPVVELEERCWCIIQWQKGKGEGQLLVPLIPRLPHSNSVDIVLYSATVDRFPQWKEGGGRVWLSVVAGMLMEKGILVDVSVSEEEPRVQRICSMSSRISFCLRT